MCVNISPPITARFICYGLLVTAQIAPLDCRIAVQRYPPLFITAYIDIRALRRLVHGDDLRIRESRGSCYPTVSSAGVVSSRGSSYQSLGWFREGFLY